MSAKHTPTPWRVDPTALGDIETEDGQMQIGEAQSIHRAHELGCFHLPHEDIETARANAAFIVRACNAHDDLVTQLKGVIAAFRCVISSLDIDEGETTLNISAGGRAVAQVPIATLLANANEALAKAEAQS